jgi:outer membrane receptor protein involved in Fe transport
MRRSVPFTEIALFVLCTLFVPFAAAPVLAQTAQVSGHITDGSGGAVPGAVVTITNLATGVLRTSVANEEGYYAVPLLPPGQYRVEVQMDGFAPVTRDALALVAEQTARLDFTLKVGDRTEQVTVAARSVLETDHAGVGTTVTDRSIRELPLNVRDPIGLVSLTPGVVTVGSFGNGGGRDVGRNFFKADFRVGGGRNRGQDVLLDGVSDSTGDRSFLAYIPPVDATQEFKVDVNGFSAEFGRTTGGILSVVTRAGTNSLSGTAYEFHRNSAFDSVDYFTRQRHLTRPDFTRNQVGSVGGGPLARDRTFFFAAYEGLRQDIPLTLISTVPTLAQRRGDFSQTFDAQGRLVVIYDPLTRVRQQNGQVVRQPFPDNRIPDSRIDIVARNVLQNYPEPNQPGDPVTGANNYATTSNQSTKSNNYSIRVDHNLTSNHRIFARYSFQRSDQQTAARWPGPSSSDTRKVIDRYYHIVAGDTLILSPTLTVDVKAGFARAHANQVSPDFDLSSLGFPSSFADVAPDRFPIFNISDITGIGNGFLNNQPRNTYTLVGQVNKLAGRHFLKAGLDYRVLQFNAFQNDNAAGSFNFTRGMTQGPVANVASTTAGYGVASFLLGAGSSGTVDHISGLALERKYYALFLQDDWRLSNRLTLNLGLRYDVTMGQTERHDRLTWFDLETTSPLAARTGLPLRGQLEFVGSNGNPREQLATDWNNVAPRVGAAYQLNDRTVVRGGYGIFYVPMIVFASGSVGFNTSTPWVATIDGLSPENYLHNPFPQGFNLPTGTRDPLSNVGFGLTGYIRNEPVGYTQQWNLSIQRDLGLGIIADVSYMGNKGTNLQWGSGIEENALDPQYLALGDALNERVANPFYGIIPTGALSGTTVTRRQLLLPYPQYTSVRRQFPMEARAIYHALAVKAERRVSNGVTLLGSYVWSKLIDESSDQEGGAAILNPYDLRAERSVSSYDVPHRVVVSAVYDLPFGRTRRFGASWSPMIDALLGGWTTSGIVTFQSGYPLAIGRPAVSDGRDPHLDNPTIARWFDTSVFSPAAPFTFGNVGRTTPQIRADGVKNMDMTISKYVPVGSRMRVQVRADAFNLFNRTQFGVPNTTVTSASFGTVSTQANSPREIQLGVKLYW